MRVFLSYAAKDQSTAEIVRRRLRDAGFSVWDSIENVTGGENWALEHGRALERADAVVALLSPAAIASRAVQGDIDYALGEKRLKGRLIPVVVRPVSKMPWILETLEPVTIGADPRRASRKIVEALRKSKRAA